MVDYLETEERVDAKIPKPDTSFSSKDTLITMNGRLGAILKDLMGIMIGGEFVNKPSEEKKEEDMFL